MNCELFYLSYDRFNNDSNFLGLKVSKLLLIDNYDEIC